MEHETWDSPVIEGRRTRPAAKTPRHQISAPEQAAIEGSPALRPSVVLGLQRTAGNGAVSALIQRSAALTEEEGDPSLVREIVGKGHGQPLDPALQDEMEARLGADFSDVRVHTDAAAAKSAAAVSARAYTVANEVVFGTDAPALDSAAGKRVLAHELTHVVQQRQGPVAGTPAGNGLRISDPSDTFEQAAEANAERVMSARPETGRLESSARPPASGLQGTSLQLQPADTAVAGDYEQEEEEETGGPAPEEAATEAGEQEEQPEAEAGEQQEEPEAEAGEAPEAAAAAPPVEMESATQPEAATEEPAPAAAEDLAQEQEEEMATETAEDQASEVEVEEDQLSQAEEGVEQAEEGVAQEEQEEEQEAAAV